MKKGFWVGAALLACGLPVAGAQLEDIHKQYQAGQVKELQLGAISCDVEVTAGDRDKTSVDIVKSNQDDFRWEIELKGAKLVVKEKSRKLLRNSSNKECLAAVSLPKGVAVKVASVSGEFKLAGLGAGLDADTTSGNMDIRLAGGGAKITTVSGGTTVRGLSGDLMFKSVSGDLEAHWGVLPARGEAHIHSVSGDAVLWLPGTPSLKAALHSVSGEVVKNDFPDSPSAAFMVKADTVSGDLSLLKAQER